MACSFKLFLCTPTLHHSCPGQTDQTNLNRDKICQRDCDFRHKLWSPLRITSHRMTARGALKGRPLSSSALVAKAPRFNQASYQSLLFREATKHAALLSKRMSQQVKQATAELQATLHAANKQPAGSSLQKRASAPNPRIKHISHKSVQEAMVTESLEGQQRWAQAELLNLPGFSCEALATGAQSLEHWVSENSTNALRYWIRFPEMPTVLLSAVARGQAATAASEQPAAHRTPAVQPGPQEELLALLDAIDMQHDAVTVVDVTESQPSDEAPGSASPAAPSRHILDLAQDSDADSDTDSDAGSTTAEAHKQKRHAPTDDEPCVQAAPLSRQPPCPLAQLPASSEADTVSAATGTDDTAHTTWQQLLKQASIIQQHIQDLASARQAALRGNRKLGKLAGGGAK